MCSASIGSARRVASSATDSSARPVWCPGVGTRSRDDGDLRHRCARLRSARRGEWPHPLRIRVRGLYGAQVWEREAEMTETFVTDVLGFDRLGEESGLIRYGFECAACMVPRCGNAKPR